jgi:hypothetical protein
LFKTFSCPVIALARDAGRFVSGMGFGSRRRQALKPPAQFIGQDDRSATALASSQLAGLNGLIQGRSAGARNSARLRNTVSKGCVHDVLAAIHREVPATTLANANDGGKMDDDCCA